MVNKFFKNNIIDIGNFEEKLFRILQEQWSNYGSGEPFYNYISTFLEMIESGEFKISKNLNNASSIKKSGNLIVFANKPIFKKVILKILECKNNGNISNKKLLKELAQMKVLIKVNGKNTYSENFYDGISRRCVKLNYSLLKKIVNGDEI